MNGQDMEDAPWWTRALERYGLPTAFALVLLWFALTVVNGQLDSLAREQTATQDTLESHINDMRLDQAETRFFLRALCFNAAESETERANCIPPSQAR